MRRNSTTQFPHKQKSNCDNCAMRFGHRGTFEQEISSLASSGITSGFELKSTSPVRPATLEADVIVPIVQALATGLATTALTYAAAGLLGFDIRVVGSFGIGTMLATWIKLLVDSRQSLIGERKLYVFSSSGRPGQLLPGSDGGVIKLEVVHSTDGIKNRMQYLDLPAGVSVEDFVEFCKQILAGKSLARKNWAGTGKLFSRDVYDELMVCLLTAGIAQKAGSVGKKLTNGGRRAVEHLMLSDGK